MVVSGKILELSSMVPRICLLKPSSEPMELSGSPAKCWDVADIVSAKFGASESSLMN